MNARLPSRRSRSQLAELRRLLRSEAKTLIAEFTRISKGQHEALERVLKAVDRLDDAKLMSELQDLRRDVEIARRALARIALAGQSTDKLRTEWNDWERHSAYVDDANHATKRERQEMIASELRMRGVRVPGAEYRMPVIEVATAPERPAETVTFALVETVPEEAPIMEEESEPPMRQENVEYWDALIASLPPESTDERAMARLLGAFRRVQGEQKRLDQRQGKRRYRMSAFDTWS